jgi:hypothetical protein
VTYLRYRMPRTKVARGPSCTTCSRELPIMQIEERKGRRGRKAEKKRTEELQGQRGQIRPGGSSMVCQHADLAQGSGGAWGRPRR